MEKYVYVVFSRVKYSRAIPDMICAFEDEGDARKYCETENNCDWCMDFFYKAVKFKQSVKE